MTVILHRTYDSAGEWYAQCAEDERNPLTLQRMKARGDNSAPFSYHQPGSTYHNWSTTTTRAEAMGLAQKGWAEGREKIAAALAKSRPLLRPARVKALSLDVAGAYPFVPAAAAGDPACMYHIGESEKATRPILRLVSEGWGSGGIDARNLVNRGAALLAHIDQLEASDIRCEVVQRYSASNYDDMVYQGKNYPRQRLNYVVDITVKRADEPLELDRMAFMLVHPSALRRLYFGSMYTQPREFGTAWTSSCGGPPTQSAREVEADQILIPTANEWTNDYTSPETSVTRIETFIHDGIKAMGLTGFMQGAGIIIDKEAA